MNPGLCLILLFLAWGGNAAYAFGPIGGEIKFWAPLPVAIGMIGFVIWHGLKTLGPRGLLRFLGIVFFVGWSFETISVVTGIPFGTYHYTAAMAPFIGHVPVFVLPAYALMGYLSWRMAVLVYRGIDQTALSPGRCAVLAAGLMVIWDLSMDPLRATIEARWIWQHGGYYFGVPFSNYIGWFVVTFVMFRWFGRDAGANGQKTHQSGDMFVPLFYLSFAVEYLLNPLTGQGVGQTAFSGGGAWSVQQLYLAVAIIAGVTMVPLGAMVFCLLRWPRETRNLLARFAPTPRSGVRG